MENIIHVMELNGEYTCNIDISVDEWKSLLCDSIFNTKRLNALKMLYEEPGHKSTCYEIEKKYGLTKYSFNPIILHTSKAVQKKLARFRILNAEGDSKYWLIMMNGKDIKYNHKKLFEWEMRPELIAAIEELGLFSILSDEDMLKSLKSSEALFTKRNFNYVGQPKLKKSARLRNGQKVYERNRQTAINALAHANFCCEIDATHPTFLRRNSDINYTEPHHLVPIEYSEQFDYSLDIEENIVSLCSNCHNQLHYGQDIEPLLKKLYYERINILKQAGIQITYEKLKEMYRLL